MFVVRPTDQRTLRGEEAVFSCSGISEPAYSIRWEKREDNQNRTIAQYLSPEDTDDSVMRFNVNGLNSTGDRGENVTLDDMKYQLEGNGSLFGQLTIFDTGLNDSSDYTCIIGNVHGTIEASASLTVQGNAVLL